MPSPSTVLLRTQSDERLVALAQAGHDRAFEAIVERYRRPLLRACRRILPEARAEDALQQALVAAWRGLQRGDDVRELRPWLYRIVRNTALNQLRVAGYDLDELVETLSATDDPQEEVARRAVVRQTLAAVASLPGRQREALLRTAIEGQPQEEVARDLGLSSTAMRQLVHRARVSVRAAATAFVPMPVAAWLAGTSLRAEPMVQRIGDLAAGAGSAGAATALAKAGTVAVLAGTAVTAPAIVKDDAPPARATTTVRSAPARAAPSPTVTPVATSAPTPAVSRVSNRGPASAGEDASKRGDDSSNRGDDSSNRGPGGDDRGDDRTRDGGHDDTLDDGLADGSSNSGPGGGEEQVTVSTPEPVQESHEGGAEPSGGGGEDDHEVDRHGDPLDVSHK